MSFWRHTRTVLRSLLLWRKLVATWQSKSPIHLQMSNSTRVAPKERRSITLIWRWQITIFQFFTLRGVKFNMVCTFLGIVFLSVSKMNYILEALTYFKSSARCIWYGDTPGLSTISLETASMLSGAFYICNVCIWGTTPLEGAECGTLGEHKSKNCSVWTTEFTTGKTGSLLNLTCRKSRQSQIKIKLVWLLSVSMNMFCV